MSLRVIRRPATRRPFDVRTGKPVPPPETLAQAARVTARALEARALGVCEPCSYQYGYSRSAGAGPARPPCALCADLVAMSAGGYRNHWPDLTCVSAKPLTRKTNGQEATA